MLNLFANIQLEVLAIYKIEKYILSFLDIPTLNSIKKINRGWHKLALNEYRRKTNQVTVFIWPTVKSLQSNNKTIYSHFSEGHAALRTYKGGKDDEGIYVSFWPGICQYNQPQNPNICHQNITHFHSRDEDDIIEKILPVEIHLKNLDINAIHLSFENLLASSIKWSIRYNCSDVVLFLLEKGGIFNYITFRRYSWLTIGLASIVLPTLAYSLLQKLTNGFRLHIKGIPFFELNLRKGIFNFSYVRRKRFFFKTQRTLLFEIKPVSLSNFLAAHLNNYFKIAHSWIYQSLVKLKFLSFGLRSQFLSNLISDFIIKAVSLIEQPTVYTVSSLPYFRIKKIIVSIETLIGSALLSTGIFYSYSMFTFSKTVLPFHIYHEIAVNDSLKLGAFNVINSLLFLQLNKILVKKNLGYLAGKFPDKIIQLMENKIQSKLLYKLHNNNKLLIQFPVLFFTFYLFAPLLLTSLIFFIKSLKDTTTTPHQIEIICKEVNQSLVPVHDNFINKINIKSTFFKSLGLKNPETINMSEKEVISKPSICTII